MVIEVGQREGKGPSPSTGSSPTLGGDKSTIKGYISFAVRNLSHYGEKEGNRLNQSEGYATRPYASKNERGRLAGHQFHRREALL